MCGIVGYIGPRDATPIILNGLKRLEYRGYDSAGVAVFNGGQIEVRRDAGKLSQLVNLVSKSPINGAPGIGHTRWATHGAPSVRNAHPHISNGGRVVVVHNGIVENFLISLDEAARRTFNQIEGANVVVLISADEPDKIVTARIGNAGGVVIGLGEGENFVASDIPAILEHTRKVIFLESRQMAVVTRDSVCVETLDGQTVQPEIHTIAWDAVSAEKGEYRHFMQKEIHEQVRALTDTLAGRVDFNEGRIRLPDLNLTPELAKRIQRIYIIACGTAAYAGMVGKYLIEKIARIPVEVVIGSEFRYSDPIIDSNTVVLAISQSGETADTLAAMEEGRRKGAILWSIVNAVGSQAMRVANGYISMQTGPERDCLYLGRGINMPIAYEGALKLKEISYIHAEGYPAGEMKHGPIALIDEVMPVVCIAPKDPWHDKMISQIQQAKARGGIVIAVATEGDELVKNMADYVLWVPETPWMLSPVVTVLPLQLLAYHIAAIRGLDVDQPRNLAKSVTVE